MELKKYGHEEQRKKLIAGIVITGGGAQLKHIKQLVEYITGMDTRIGYPNEHLAGDTDKDSALPIYSTAVGLVLNSIERHEQIQVKKQPEVKEKEQKQDLKEQQSQVNTESESADDNETNNDNKDTDQYDDRSTIHSQSSTSPRKNFFENFVDRFKDFLKNAE